MLDREGEHRHGLQARDIFTVMPGATQASCLKYSYKICRSPYEEVIYVQQEDTGDLEALCIYRAANQRCGVTKLEAERRSRAATRFSFPGYPDCYVEYLISANTARFNCQRTGYEGRYVDDLPTSYIELADGHDRCPNRESSRFNEKTVTLLRKNNNKPSRKARSLTAPVQDLKSQYHVSIQLTAFS